MFVLLRPTDARNNSIVFAYDRLNRLTYKWLDLGLYSYDLLRAYMTGTATGSRRPPAA